MSLTFLIWIIVIDAQMTMKFCHSSRHSFRMISLIKEEKDSLTWCAFNGTPLLLEVTILFLPFLMHSVLSPLWISLHLLTPLPLLSLFSISCLSSFPSCLTEQLGTHYIHITKIKLLILKKRMKKYRRIQRKSRPPWSPTILCPGATPYGRSWEKFRYSSVNIMFIGRHI